MFDAAASTTAFDEKSASCLELSLNRSILLLSQLEFTVSLFFSRTPVFLGLRCSSFFFLTFQNHTVPAGRFAPRTPAPGIPGSCFDRRFWVWKTNSYVSFWQNQLLNVAAVFWTEGALTTDSFLKRSRTSYITPYRQALIVGSSGKKGINEKVVQLSLWRRTGLFLISSPSTHFPKEY